MTLGPLKRSLIEITLGVAPKPKGFSIPTSRKEFSDRRIGGALDDYEAREGKILAAATMLTELGTLPNAATRAGALETRVKEVRQTVMDLDDRETARDAIGAARDALAETEKEARTAAKEAATDFVGAVDTLKAEFHQLVKGQDPGVVRAMADRLQAIDLALGEARGRVESDPARAGQGLRAARNALAGFKGERDTARDTARRLRDALRAIEAARKLMEAHPQRDHVAAEMKDAADTLAAARTRMEEGRFTDATFLVDGARMHVDGARDLAGRHAAFLAAYGEAVRFCDGLEKSLGASLDGLAAARTGLADARTKAGLRDHAGATNAVVAAMAPLKARKDELKARSTAGYTARLQSLDASLATIVPPDQRQGAADASALDRLKVEADTVLAAEVKRVHDMKAQIEAYAEAGAWNEVRAQRALFAELVTMTLKLAERRKAYNARRATTLAAIQGLKAHRSLLGHMMSLQALVARADGLANSRARRFEDAIKELAAIEATCAALLAVGRAADTYIAERAAADTALEELEKAA